MASHENTILPDPTADLYNFQFDPLPADPDAGDRGRGGGFMAVVQFHPTFVTAEAFRAHGEGVVRGSGGTGPVGGEGSFLLGCLCRIPCSALGGEVFDGVYGGVWEGFDGSFCGGFGVFWVGWELAAFEEG